MSHNQQSTNPKQRRGICYRCAWYQTRLMGASGHLDSAIFWGQWDEHIRIVHEGDPDVAE